MGISEGDAESAPLMPGLDMAFWNEGCGQWAAGSRHDGTDNGRVNLDYDSEADDAELRLNPMLHPIVIALYTNSACVDGAWSDVMSRRAQIWETTAPLRTRLPDVVYQPNARFGIISTGA